jgi:hypothetical protein
MLTVWAGSAVSSRGDDGEDVGTVASVASGTGEALAGSNVVTGEGSGFSVVTSAASFGGDGLIWSTVVASVVVGEVWVLSCVGVGDTSGVVVLPVGSPVVLAVGSKGAGDGSASLLFPAGVVLVVLPSAPSNSGNGDASVVLLVVVAVVLSGLVAVALPSAGAGLLPHNTNMPFS